MASATARSGLPDALPAATYTLVARGLDNVFPEERLPFDVVGSTTPHPPASTVAKPLPAHTGTLSVQFFPEGGHLAAGIENRVYFAALDAKGQPLEIRGNIVDGKGKTVTPAETVFGGLGVFNITPDAAETYRLTVTSPAGISETPLLPKAAAEQPIAVATGRGIVPPATAGVQSPRAEGPPSAGHHGPGPRHARGSANVRHFATRTAGEACECFDSPGRRGGGHDPLDRLRLHEESGQSARRAVGLSPTAVADDSGSRGRSCRQSRFRSRARKGGPSPPR